MKPELQRTALLGLVPLCALLALLSMLVGAESLDLSQALRDWQSGKPIGESPTLSVLFNLRAPRTLAALLAGAGLAVAGCVFQALLRNPLATPYTLGVANSSALGAWLGLMLVDYGHLHGGLLGVPAKQALAFLFAAANVSAVYFLAARSARVSPAVLLLAGVTFGMLANAGIVLGRHFATPNRLVMMDRWLMGGVDIIGYGPVWTMALGVLPCCAVLLALAGPFDQYAFGVELAAARGVNVRRLQITAFLAASLLTAIIVSEVGPIGFVGLIVPHAVRAFTGPGHRRLMPASLVAGGAFLCACDIVARRILPGETPIGVITTLIGGPFFLYLLTRKRFAGWDA